MPRSDSEFLRAFEPNRIRDDLIRKSAIDTFKLMKRNYELLTMTGHPNDPGIQFTFIITVITTVLSITVKVFATAGLDRPAVEALLAIVNNIVLDEADKAKAGEQKGEG